jgi:hypothetical protein
VVARTGEGKGDCASAFSASKIRIIPGDIGNSGHRPRCGTQDVYSLDWGEP